MSEVLHSSPDCKRLCKSNYQGLFSRKMTENNIFLSADFVFFFLYGAILEFFIEFFCILVFHCNIPFYLSIGSQFVIMAEVLHYGAHQNKHNSAHKYNSNLIYWRIGVSAPKYRHFWRILTAYRFQNGVSVIRRFSLDTPVRYANFGEI